MVHLVQDINQQVVAISAHCFPIYYTKADILRVIVLIGLYRLYYVREIVCKISFVLGNIIHLQLLLSW